MVARTPGSFAGLSGWAVAGQCLIFLVVLVGPIYLGQAGLKLTNPLLSSVVSAIGPITTLGLQSAAGAVALSPAMLVVTALYAIVSITAAVIGAVGSKTAAVEPILTFQLLAAGAVIEVAVERQNDVVEKKRLECFELGALDLDI
jgi:hypothetical protein